MPILTSSACSQNKQKGTTLMVITFGSLLNGITDMHVLHLSFMTLILHSTSATCSDATLVLMMTSGSSGITLLNSMSMNGITDMHVLHLSFMTLILHSTSATCSDATLVLMMTSGSSGITLLNSMSIKIV